MIASNTVPVPKPGFPVADLGLLPFLMLLPFLYMPKFLEGDTQPWVLLGALIALFIFRPKSFLLRHDLTFVLLALLGFAAYVARAGFMPETLRAAYIFLTFIVLWMVVSRGRQDLLRFGVKLTLTVWFIAAAYQYLAMQLGQPVTFAGRFVEGRGGVPGLTAEPSYLGSLSVLMMMHLLHDRRPGDGPFLFLGLLNVLLSGSLLSLLLLAFPATYLRPAGLFAAISALMVLVLVDLTINPSGGLSARLEGFQDFGAGLVTVLMDPSLNLRFGHIWFTLWENILRSLLFLHPIDFQNQYNQFVAKTDLLFMPTESNFILPMAGELIYSGGVFGLALVLVLVARAGAAGETAIRRFIRSSFMLACLINPISIANPFLIFYVLQQRPCPAR